MIAALIAGWSIIGVVTAIGATSLSPQPVDTEPVADLPRLDHYVCCRDDTTALCGLDVTGYPWGTEGGPHCVVCLDLNDHPLCPISGTPCPW